MIDRDNWLDDYARRFAWGLVAVMLGLGLVLLTLGFLAARAHAHDPYSAWKDRHGYSCCDNRDCRPVRADRDDAGRWRVYVDGRWVPVPADAILPFPSPDGRSHACMTPTALEPRCVVIGEVRG